MRKLWVALAVCFLAGCGHGGGGGSSPPPALTTSITGVAMDGYLSNASVFFDLNDNGILDSGEPSATTGSGGTYALVISPSDVGKHSVVLKAIAGQTIDADNPGVPISTGYVLSATADRPDIISPLTTQVAAAILAAPSLSTAQAEAQVMATLGLSGSSSSLFQDFANKSNQATNANLISLANHAKVIRTQMQTETAANPAASPLEVMKAVASNVQAQIKSGALDLTKINITTLIDDAGANSIIVSGTKGAAEAAAKGAADAAAAKTAADAAAIKAAADAAAAKAAADAAAAKATADAAAAKTAADAAAAKAAADAAAAKTAAEAAAIKAAADAAAAKAAADAATAKTAADAAAAAAAKVVSDALAAKAAADAAAAKAAADAAAAKVAADAAAKTAADAAAAAAAKATADAAAAKAAAAAKVAADAAANGQFGSAKFGTAKFQ